MQAQSNLSPQQRSALESSYTFFAGAAPFLEFIESKLAPDEQLAVRNLRDLAGVCQYRLVEAFPELHTWLAEWTLGGGQ
jgi:hypothetical protein